MKMMRAHLKVFSRFAFTAVLFTSLLALIFKRINRTNGVLVSSGEKRRYLLYVPKSYIPGAPTPLVISIHGFAEWPAHQAYISRWNRLADQYGFIVVYPMGTGYPLRWRALFDPQKPDSTDVEVKFFTDLIGHLARQYSIDPRRIYANGLSNGAGMAYLLSLKLADRIAAIGVVAGAYLYPPEQAQPARCVPVIGFHGDADPVVPFRGGSSRRFDLPFPDVPAWFEQWAVRCDCPRHEEFSPAPTVSAVRYTGEDALNEVVFYSIAGGGHSWPGGNPIPRWIVGSTSQAVDATGLMWEFFARHPLPG